MVYRENDPIVSIRDHIEKISDGIDELKDMKAQAPHPIANAIALKIRALNIVATLFSLLGWVSATVVALFLFYTSYMIVVSDSRPDFCTFDYDLRELRSANQYNAKILAERGWIVNAHVDWGGYNVYGPFNTKEEAKEIAKENGCP